MANISKYFIRNGHCEFSFPTISSQFCDYVFGTLDQSPYNRIKYKILAIFSAEPYMTLTSTTHTLVLKGQSEILM